MSVTGTGAVSQDAQITAVVGAESSANGGFLWPNQPNLIDFLSFLTNTVQIPAAALPASSPWPQYCLTQALGLVLCLPGVPSMLRFSMAGIPQVISYTLAVYNCATHLLVGSAPDQPGQNFFTVARSNADYSLINPSTGIVASTSDVTTSTALASPDWAKGMTISNLDFFKTPWGRQFLSYNQSYGPTIVALT